MTLNFKSGLVFCIVLTTLPFLYLLSDIDYSLYQTSNTIFWINLWQVLGSITGIVGAILLVWSMFLGVRFLTVYISFDQIWIYKLHKVLGKYGGIVALMHPLFLMVAYGENVLWLFLPDFSSNFATQITLGRIAFLCLLLIWFSSITLRDWVSYRTWLLIHYLSYPLVLLSLLHALDIGIYLYKIPFLLWIWILFIVCSIVFMILRAVYMSGVFSYKYKIEYIKFLTEEIFEVGLLPHGRRIKSIIPGQYFYIQLGAFRETHPFSYMRYEKKTGRIIFGIQILGNWTERFSKSKVGEIVNLDGPYGVFTQEHKFEDLKVCIAGGIGITPFVDGILKQPQNTILFNCNRYLESTICSGELTQALGKNMHMFLTKENIEHPNFHNCRIHFEGIEKILGEKIKTAHFYICGSQGFNSAMSKMLLDGNVDKSHIHIEDFF